MVTLAGYPPASLIWDVPRLQDEADRTRDALRDLCAPLAEVSNRRSLESYLATVEPRYLRLLQRLMSVALRDQAQLLDLFRDAEESRQRINSLIDDHRQMLGEEACDRLIAATGSLYGLSRWAMRTVERALEGDSTALVEGPPFTAEVTKRAAWAGLCFLTIRLVFDGELKEWQPASLRVLIIAFDDYMESIEDAFLAALPPSELSDHSPISSLSDVLDLQA